MKEEACREFVILQGNAIGPKNKCMFFLAPSHGLFLTCRGENLLIAQKAFIEHRQQYLTHIWLKYNLLLVQRCELPSTPVPC